MSHAWPADLPQHVREEGYAEHPQDTTIRSPMDAGPAKVRRRFTAPIDTFDIEMILTPAQAETLREFCRDTLAGGSLEFDWLHPRTQEAVTMRFLAPPELSPADGFYSASISVEVLP